jgi:hypothetical protein
MNWRRMKLSAMLAGAVIVGSSSAQTPTPQAGPTGIASAPASSVVLNIAPLTSTAPVPPMGPSDHAQPEDVRPPCSSGLYTPDVIVAEACAGMASATSVVTAGGKATTATSITSSPAPAVLPGLFTAINSEPARPANRVFVEYGYFDSFPTISSTTGLNLHYGFDLNSFNLGAELAFLDNRASVTFRLPFLQATQNVAEAPVDGLGDISVGVKYALLCCEDSGSTLSVGLTVAAPTAPDAKIATSRYLFDFDPTGTKQVSAAGQKLPVSQLLTVNPAYIQPWVGGIAVLDRLMVSSYLACVIPTDDAVPLFFNGDVSLGYQFYRCDNSESWLTSITPTFSTQVLAPLGDQSMPGAKLFGHGTVKVATGGQLVDTRLQQSFTIQSDPQVFLTEGVSLGIGCRSILSIGVVTSVVGSNAYNVGGVVSFNFFF